ncbi:hypothetical protein [Candidatus Viridilinea mediisalina]|uniref:Glycosyltransferase RgtA/B/C/D-like domain-containing protein n=1 Tax=Candidatus Viridilinea mediisalina TaxID=2024553 RepID=A0A2A6RLH0_9CHLR|nr:hypothetical protein [Candidatus Viridilinea mediisalina]PDW03729.1 hypothetical protein CJ255_07425 [Candidatus Viridilinea mediisalina]
MAWLVEPCLLIGLLVAWVIGAGMVQRELTPQRIELTQPLIESEAHWAGLYDLEQWPAEPPFLYRWTSGYFFAQIPWAYHAAPRYAVHVRLSSGPGEPRPLTFLSNEQAFATTLPQAGFRVYRLLLPPPAEPEPNLRFAIAIEPWQQPGDPRPLGLMMTDLEFYRLPYTAPENLLIVSMGSALLWGLARWRGARVGGAFMLCTPLIIIFLILYAYLKPSPLTYATMVGFSFIAAGAGIFLAQGALLRLGIAILGSIMSFSGMIWASWLSDDAFISFHYAQNFLLGHGLVYNPGERVEGYTNFLYTMLIALVLWLEMDPILWSYQSGVIWALGLLLLTYTVGQRLLGSVWGGVAALFVATSQSLLLHSTRGGGLETAFYAMLIVLAISLYLWHMNEAEEGLPTRLRLCSVGIVLALASLTRPEGLLVFALTILHALVYDLRWSEWGHIRAFMRRKRGIIALIAPYLLIIIPFFLWRYSYYGEWLPNTFYAKTGGGGRAVMRGLAYSWSFAQTMGGPLLIIALGGFIANWRQRLGTWRGYMLLIVSIYTTYIIVVGGDHFRGERFFVPLVPLLAILLADGLATLISATKQRLQVYRTAQFLLICLLISYSFMALNRTREFEYIIRGLDESVDIWREIGWWMADHTTSEQSIAVAGAGAIAFYGQRTTIDMHGLNDHYIARVEMATMGTGPVGHEKRAPDYVLNQRRPTYIPHLWTDYFPNESYLTRDYQLITINTRYGRELLMWQRRPS